MTAFSTNSMNIKPFRALLAQFTQIESADAFCGNAKYAFQEYLAAALYERHSADALYIYQIESHRQKHTGLVALNEVEAFFAGKVLKHEKTLSEKEQQQIQLFLEWQSVLKPMLLTHRPVESLHQRLISYTQHHKPVRTARFHKEHQTHRIWAITEPEEIAAIQALFNNNVDQTYIADGHHRTSTMALLHERRHEYPQFDFNHLFCAFFPTDQLDILDYNRVVEAFGALSTSRFWAQLSKIADLEVLDTPRRPTQKHEIVIYLRKEWFALRWKPETVAREQAQRGVVLDANLLNELVLRDILGIQDARTDSRIAYVDGSKGLDGLRKSVKRSKTRIGFMLFPVLFDDMMFMADRGQSLPPKSTYFEPRLKSGALVQDLRVEG
ncbi:MAG: DUF1015 domain-containing protein [Chitinophagales bacterium]|nr:DUF1015 domain-containing protein [Chitinophagales bacterium]